MNDADVVRIARRIDVLNFKIHLLVQQIEESDHPNAAELVRDLQSDSFDNPAWATHVIAHQLETPDKWETGYFKYIPPNGIRKKKAQP